VLKQSFLYILLKISLQLTQKKKKWFLDFCLQLDLVIERIRSGPELLTIAEYCPFKTAVI